MNSKMKKSWTLQKMMSKMMKSTFYKLAMKEKNPIKTLKTII